MYLLLNKTIILQLFLLFEGLRIVLKRSTLNLYTCAYNTSYLFVNSPTDEIFTVEHLTFNTKGHQQASHNGLYIDNDICSFSHLSQKSLSILYLSHNEIYYT